MIATERFVFIHLHTCGGRLVTEFVMRFMPDPRSIGYHLPRRLIPPSLAQLPVLGFVRNPWSYYVLWYTFQVRRPAPSALFRILSADRQLDFEHTVRNMLDLGVTGNLLDASIAALPERFAGSSSGLNLPGPALAPIRGSGLGFFSFLYHHMYDAPGVLHVRRIERVRDELLSMLAAVGQPVSAAMRAYLNDAPAGRVSEPKDYAAHYSPALRDLVAQRDKNLISRYGYRFGE